MTTVGRGIRFEGNLRVSEVKVFLDASDWYIIRSGFVFSSQLQLLAGAKNCRVDNIPEGL